MSEIIISRNKDFDEWLVNGVEIFDAATKEAILNIQLDKVFTWNKVDYVIFSVEVKGFYWIWTGKTKQVYSEEFKTEYQHAIEDPNDLKAELLWLWYDYHTEIYDRSLPSCTYPFKGDPTMSMATNPDDRALSGRYSASVKEQLRIVANYYKIPDLSVQRARNNNERMNARMQHRLDVFEALNRRSAFKFFSNVLREEENK